MVTDCCLPVLYDLATGEPVQTLWNSCTGSVGGHCGQRFLIQCLSVAFRIVHLILRSCVWMCVLMTSCHRDLHSAMLILLMKKFDFCANSVGWLGVEFCWGSRFEHYTNSLLIPPTLGDLGIVNSGLMFLASVAWWLTIAFYPINLV